MSGLAVPPQNCENVWNVRILSVWRKIWSQFNMCVRKHTHTQFFHYEKKLHMDVATNSAIRTSFVPRSYNVLGLSMQCSQYSDTVLTKQTGLRRNRSELLWQILPFPIPADTQAIQFSVLPLWACIEKNIAKKKMAPQVPRSYKITFLSFREPDINPSGQTEISFNSGTLCAHAKTKHVLF